MHAGCFLCHVHALQYCPFHTSSTPVTPLRPYRILSGAGNSTLLTARMVERLGYCGRYRQDLGGKMKAELERLAAVPVLSRNVLELVGRALEG